MGQSVFYIIYPVMEEGDGKKEKNQEINYDFTNAQKVAIFIQNTILAKKIRK